jgi:hypothetical protein
MAPYAHGACAVHRTLRVHYDSTRSSFPPRSRDRARVRGPTARSISRRRVVDLIMRSTRSVATGDEEPRYFHPPVRSLDPRPAMGPHSPSALGSPHRPRWRVLSFITIPPYCHITLHENTVCQRTMYVREHCMPSAHTHSRSVQSIYIKNKKKNKKHMYTHTHSRRFSLPLYHLYI